MASNLAWGNNHVAPRVGGELLCLTTRFNITLNLPRSFVELKKNCKNKVVGVEKSGRLDWEDEDEISLLYL